MLESTKMMLKDLYSLNKNLFKLSCVPINTDSRDLTPQKVSILSSSYFLKMESKDTKKTTSEATISEKNYDTCNKLNEIAKEKKEELQQKLSKNALKKLRKQQKWEETREARKLALKEKDKRKKEERRKAKELGLCYF